MGGYEKKEGGSDGTRSTCNTGDPGSRLGRSPGEGDSHSSILAWRIPGLRSLVGYSPWGCKELDMTEQLAFSFLRQF